jgi:hypothetical protein
MLLNNMYQDTGKLRATLQCIWNINTHVSLMVWAVSSANKDYLSPSADSKHFIEWKNTSETYYELLYGRMCFTKHEIHLLTR